MGGSQRILVVDQETPLGQVVGGVADGLREGMRQYVGSRQAAQAASGQGRDPRADLEVAFQSGLRLGSDSQGSASLDVKAAAKALIEAVYTQFMTTIGPGVRLRKCIICHAFVEEDDDEARCKGRDHQLRSSRHILEDVTDVKERAVGLTRLACTWLHDGVVAHLPRLAMIEGAEPRGSMALA